MDQDLPTPPPPQDIRIVAIDLSVLDWLTLLAKAGAAQLILSAVGAVIVLVLYGLFEASK